MLKLAGMALIAAAALGYGFWYGLSLRKELRRFEGFRRLIETVRSRVSCFNQPLSAVYRDFSDEELDACGFTDLLRAGIPFSEALIRKRDVLGLREELFGLLSDLGRDLGRSYREDQVRLCERFLTEADARLAALRAEMPDRIRLARGLSAAAAAMTVLLLL